jgi:hypothetical protein
MWLRATWVRRVDPRHFRRHARCNASCMRPITKPMANLSALVQSLDPDMLSEAWARVDRLYDALLEMQTAVSATETVDAGAFLRAMCEHVRDHAATRDVKVIVFATCTGVRVHARSFAEAMFNLVDNAIDGARPGSEIIITVRPTGGSDVVWEIVGGGIDQIVGHAGAATTASLPALNVALAQLAVEAHGGLLHFEGEEGRAMSASVWIPLARQAVG